MSTANRGVFVFGELRSLIEELGTEIENAMGIASSEVSELRRWNRAQGEPVDEAEAGKVTKVRLAKSMAETLIRIGRATATIQRVASEAEHLENLAISSAVDLWPIFDTNDQTNDQTERDTV